MTSVLVLNADFSELNVTTLNRALILVTKGKAEILKHADDLIKSEKISIKKPLIIRLLNYISAKMNKFKVSRGRIYKRDNNQCAYCGSAKNLTIDHVLPKSRGGKNEWTNLVTCCHKCNFKKADKTPEEAGMKLRFKPFTPNIIEQDKTIKEAWEKFMSSFF